MINNIYGKNLIDRFNPFNNFTENRDYNGDYRRIAPQISFEDCEIPDIPASAEKARIKRHYNRAGSMMLIHFVTVNVLAWFMMYIVSIVISAKDKASVDYLPFNYGYILNDYLGTSSISMAMNLFVMLLINVFIFLLGCKINKISIPSLFQTTDLKKGTAVRYAFFGLFIQLGAGFITYFIDLILGIFGIESYSPDFSISEHNYKLIAVTAIYTCIIAPVTEELLFRGFLLKMYSKASQRAGIFATAFLFAVFHENISQGVLAFIMGIFLGSIVIRHNSVVPSIIVHMTVNTFSMINSIIYIMLNEQTANIISGIISIIVFITSLFMFIYSLVKIKDRLPKATRAQRKRGLPLAFSSWSMILVTICHTFLAVFMIISTNS